MMTTEKTPAKSSVAQANEIEITPKSSRAIVIWLAVVAVVLSILWFETRNSVGHNFNLFLSGEADTVGSEVFVDGKKLGVMVASGNSGLGGGAFWAYVNDGPHLIEVRKKQFGTFSKQINMKREDYIGVSLKPAKHLNSFGGDEQ